MSASSSVLDPDKSSKFAPFQDVCRYEHQELRKRRLQADCPSPEGNGLLDDTVGLALSGGGVRSATFSLGVLQAMHRYGILKCVDYLSTVSGGGYIGSSLTWFCSRGSRTLKKDFPFGTSREDNLKEPGLIRAWLRDHGNVVTPGREMGIWAFAGSILSASIFNLLIIVPVVMLAFMLLGQNVPDWLMQNPETAALPLLAMESFYDVLYLFGFTCIAAFLVLTLGQALFSNTVRRADLQISGHNWRGRLLRWSLVLIAVGSVPDLYRVALRLMGELGAAQVSALSLLTSFISIFGARKAEQSGKIRNKRILSFLLWLGASLIIVVLAMAIYSLTIASAAWPRWVLGAWFGAAIVLILFANFNHVSAHRYYRNALMRAYLARRKDLKLPPNGEKDDPDDFALWEIRQTDAPYQLINVAMNTIGSQNPKLRARGADNFIFSRLYSGFDNRYLRLPSSPEEAKASCSDEEAMMLATAMTISGAAVNPNAYATRARPIAFLMTLFNIRLGYWITRPIRTIAAGCWGRRMSTFACIYNEMTGTGLRETNANVHLSDGGHFENLGLYELIRRRCKYIFVIDAGRDVDYCCSDLGKVVELARMDFGAKITIDLDRLRRSSAPGQAQDAFTIGTVDYLVDATDGLPQVTRGYILYVKPTLLKSIPRDVETYGLSNTSFPQDSTADQWYDERQFESYRELGYQITRHIIRDRSQLPGDSLNPELFLKWIETSAKTLSD